MKGARPLEPKEVRVVLKACQDQREKTMILLGLNLGLRIGELVTLQWRDLIKPDQNPQPMLYLDRRRTKGKKARAVPMNSQAHKAIRAWWKEAGCLGLGRQPRDSVFPGRFGDHISLRQGHRLLGELFDRAGLGGHVSSHSLRKSFGTWLCEQGVPLPAVMELVGHVNLSTTQRYIGVGAGQLRKAVRGLEGLV